MFFAIIWILAVAGIWKMVFTAPKDTTIDLDKFKKGERFTELAECVEKYQGTDCLYISFKLIESGKLISMPVDNVTYGEIAVGQKGNLYYGIYKNMKIFGHFE